MRFMVDSTNINDDPLTAQLVAYYVDGIYAVNVAAVIARFPRAVLVPVSAVGTDRGIVGDVEPGCMTNVQAVSWVQRRRAAGFDPTLYVNETYGWVAVRAAFRAAGVPEPHWWVANYDGIAQVPAGAVAKQYANPTLTHGHFDLSVVADYWPGVDDPRAGDSPRGGTDLTPEESSKLHEIWAVIKQGYIDQPPADNPSNLWWLSQALNNMMAAVQQLRTDVDEVKSRVETIQQAPAIGAEHTTPPGP